MAINCHKWLPQQVINDNSRLLMVINVKKDIDVGVKALSGTNCGALSCS